MLSETRYYKYPVRGLCSVCRHVIIKWKKHNRLLHNGTANLLPPMRKVYQ